MNPDTAITFLMFLLGVFIGAYGGLALALSWINPSKTSKTKKQQEKIEAEKQEMREEVLAELKAMQEKDNKGE